MSWNGGTRLLLLGRGVLHHGVGELVQIEGLLLLLMFDSAMLKLMQLCPWVPCELVQWLPLKMSI